MRALINFLLRIYLLPLRLSPRLARYAKGRILQFDNHYNSTLDVIRRHFPDDINPVVDVGAFDGDSTVYFAKHLSRNKILGFEPNPGPYQRGLLNTKHYGNIELFNIAFANTTGEMNLFVTNDAVSSSLLGMGDSKEFRLETSIKVDVSTLDVFFQNYDGILLLKLDVQGAELDILKAGQDTVMKTRCILTEVLNANLYEGGCQYFEVDEFLRSAGFKIHSIFSDYNYAGTKYFDVLYINTRFSSL